MDTGYSFHRQAPSSAEASPSADVFSEKVPTPAESAVSAGSSPAGEAKAAQRHLGIEIFRMVSMMLIILLHILGNGGILSHTTGAKYQAAWLLETIGYCSVNCYAMISGWANAKSRFRFRRVVFLELEVVFFTVTTTAIFALFVPAAEITTDLWLLAIFPLARGEYWYFNAYVLLFAFLPILNRGLAAIDRAQYRLLLIFLFVLTTLLSRVNAADPFVLGGGYSAIWLIVLYVFGAYVRLHGIPRFFKRWVSLLLFALCALIPWGLRALAGSLLSAGKVASGDYGYKMLTTWISYTSPFMVIMAFSLLCFFASLHPEQKLSQNRGGGVLSTVLLWFGRSTFGVYLFHVGTSVWTWWLKNRFIFLTGWPLPLLVLGTLGVTVGLYIVWSLFSMLRILLFRLLRIDALINRLSDLLGPKVGLKG